VNIELHMRNLIRDCGRWGGTRINCSGRLSGTRNAEFGIRMKIVVPHSLRKKVDVVYG